MSEKVLLLGWRPYEEIPALISASDICILPAQRNRIMQDIVPIKMYEYLAFSKPVVVTALPGIIREFGTNNGVIYAKNPENVMNKCYLVASNNLNYEFGRKGRKFIEKHCNWNDLTQIFLERLEMAIDTKKRHLRSFN